MSGKYVRHEAVEVMEMDGETVILNQKTFAVTKLNGVGGWVWKELGESSTFESLEKRMAEAFGTDRQRVRQDLQRFLGRMTEIGLIRFAK